MKNAELIEVLRTMPADADVFFPCYEYGQPVPVDVAKLVEVVEDTSHPTPRGPSDGRFGTTHYAADFGPLPRFPEKPGSRRIAIVLE